MGYPLASVSATFVSDGVGGTICRAVAAPTRAGISWSIDLIATTVSPGSTPSSQLKVYRGVESVTTYVEGTYSADNDTSDTHHELKSMDSLTFVWTGGTLGAVATATLHGTIRDARGLL